MYPNCPICKNPLNPFGDPGENRFNCFSCKKVFRLKHAQELNETQIMPRSKITETDTKIKRVKTGSDLAASAEMVAQKAVNHFKEATGEGLEFNLTHVIRLDKHIEFIIGKNQHFNALCTLYGAYIGQTIITEFGGTWEKEGDELRVNVNGTIANVVRWIQLRIDKHEPLTQKYLSFGKLVRKKGTGTPTK